MQTMPMAPLLTMAGTSSQLLERQSSTPGEKTLFESPQSLGALTTQYGAAICKELHLSSAAGEVPPRRNRETDFRLLSQALAQLKKTGKSDSPALDALVAALLGGGDGGRAIQPGGNVVAFGSKNPLCLVTQTPGYTLTAYMNMLWDFGVTQVVALASAPWWHQSGVQAFGDITLTLQSHRTLQCTKDSGRLLSCSMRRGADDRTLTVLRIDWPDFGIISPAAYIRFCDELQKSAVPGPLAVHCRAGLGRSGTFVAAWALMRAVREGDASAAAEDGGSVNKPQGALQTYWAGVCSFVGTRAQRAGAVETAEQFSFIFEVGQSAQKAVQ